MFNNSRHSYSISLLLPAGSAEGNESNKQNASRYDRNTDAKACDANAEQ